ncbi:MAG: DUF3575 domain-containing protein [Bacteroidales bacterium]|nr:DUF3575 domain-containing protein [Bacteroidales bacterium]
MAARKYLLYVFLWMLFGTQPLTAQSFNSNTSHNDTLKFHERLSFRTNTIDWLLLRPNIGMEFDLRAGDYNKWTIGVDALYNWKTKETDVNPYVYDIMQVTLEGRKYYRTRRPDRDLYPDGVVTRDTSVPAFVGWLKYITRLDRAKARSWRAYYWGAYASATQYSFKFGDTGYQGPAYSVGASFGYGIPLYVLGNGTIDLEIGGRIGAAITKYDAYTVDFEGNCYPYLPEKSKGYHFLPYPVINDLHLSLVYRTRSIRNKYRKPNFAKEKEMMERQYEIDARHDSILEARRLRKEEMRSQVEIVGKAKKAKKLRKQRADSLGVALDSIPLTPEEIKAKALIDKLEQQKLEEQQRKNEQKLLRKKEKEDKRVADNLATKEAKMASDEAKKASKEAKKAAKQAKKAAKKASTDADRKEIEQ